MKSSWLRYTVLAIVCLGLGAYGHRIKEKLTAKEPKVMARKRGVPIKSVSPRMDLEQLQALGYVDGTFDPNSERSGVVEYKADKVSPGYNFYCSQPEGGARLLDMDGREVHAWSGDSEQKWKHAELLPSGDVVVIVNETRLTRYDKDSRAIWSIEGRYHHDLCLDGGDVYALMRESLVRPDLFGGALVLHDFVEIRSLDGELRRRISLLDVLRDSSYGYLLPALPPVSLDAMKYAGKELDVLHANHVEVFDGRLAERDPIYADGNIMVSLRNINTIVILDGDTDEILWAWGPSTLTFQHHPTLLEDGHILVFDNGLELSRVLELDPLTLQITWQYAPESDFFSRTRGSSQRLPNGNTLVTESNRGYAFEITPGGEVVWEFANPGFLKDSRRAVIWRMQRIDPATLDFVQERD